MFRNMNLRFTTLKIGQSIIVRAYRISYDQALDLLALRPSEVNDIDKLKQAYRKTALKNHPDREQDPFKKQVQCNTCEFCGQAFSYGTRCDRMDEAIKAWNEGKEHNSIVGKEDENK
jgi:hypothetical protein